MDDVYDKDVKDLTICPKCRCSGLQKVTLNTGRSNGLLYDNCDLCNGKSLVTKEVAFEYKLKVAAK